MSGYFFVFIPLFNVISFICLVPPKKEVCDLMTKPISLHEIKEIIMLADCLLQLIDYRLSRIDYQSELYVLEIRKKHYYFRTS